MNTNRLRSQNSILRAAGLTVMWTCAVASLLLVQAGGTSDAASIQSEQPTKIIFSLDYAVDGLHAPMLVAQSEGYYKDAGLDVTIVPSSGSLDAVARVSTGVAQLGDAGATDVYDAIAKSDADIQAIGDLLRYTPASIMSLKESGIRTLADLKGKTVAINPNGDTAGIFKALLKANGYPSDYVKVISMNGSAEKAALLTKKIDAVSAFANVYAPLVDKLNIIPEYKHGVTIYSTVLFGNRPFMASHPAAIKAFMAATFKGLSFTLASPDKAAAIIAAVSKVDAAYYASELQMLRPLWKDADSSHGRISSKDWLLTQKFATDYLGAPAVSDLHRAFTNDYLPRS